MAAHGAMTESDAAARLASILIEAHAAGESITALSVDAEIASRDEAYRAQAAVARRLGPVIGWKVGRKGPDAAPARAPLLANRVHRSGDSLERDAFRLWLLEAELMFRLHA